MQEIVISKELARQFAYDCFDVIVREIQEQEDKEAECDMEKQAGQSYLLKNGIYQKSTIKIQEVITNEKKKNNPF